MDALGEVLGAVRMTGGVFLDARFSAPWCVSANMDAGDLEPFLQNPVQMIAYHYVIQGRMQVMVDGESPLEVRAGETVVFARNDRHILGSALPAQPVRTGHLIQRNAAGALGQVVHGGGGEPTHIVCGFLGSAEHRNPLIATLPRALKVDMVGAGSSEWIEASLGFALKGLREGKIGSSTIMSKLSELMFVEAVRGYAATLPPERKGWLAGMRDPVVGQALALMHGRVNHPWTAEELAREVALSRSAFSDRRRARRHAAHALSHPVAHAACQRKAARRPPGHRPDRL
ncbi:cupin domain-containing protein [Mesorhizobium sp. LHD-90]|uniref:cupin domain-containing protein n=1 Tax=Mesorhizobium sp. LHD-90 TaxID=3071414 RepID=UPI0027DFAD61|nr:cupin domain-containing protein [Mesorhizobium sp. LHD-90]MDQ6432504.1 cupin domain-containing protein [Mesorhizobium sp. LHD-90]